MGSPIIGAARFLLFLIKLALIPISSLVNNSLFSKIDQHKCLNHQTFEDFNFSFSNSSTASLNVPNILVTNTDLAIVEREVSSLFVGGGQNNHSKGGEKRPILGKLRNQQLSSLNLLSIRFV
ncbi:MAG: hypothetical protein K5779_05635 [Saccharofermentans sp.]|nr:hypothetical protein [Saccharofermentans sp.]